MKYDEVKELVENIVENEYLHISDHGELEFTDTNIEYKNADDKYYQTFDKLEQTISKEYIDLLGQLEEEATERMRLLCRFYFKQGVAAGVSNLQFIKEIDGIGIETLL